MDEIVSIKSRLPEFRAIGERRGDFRDFGSAIRRTDKMVRVIAETKKASPSAGLMAAKYDPAQVARRYADAGADAISVLTEQNYFGGQPEHLIAVRQAVALPVLRKDFIIDVLQVFEARSAGADAVLLIVAILSDEQLAHFAKAASKLGMHALIEVHSEDEVRRVLPLRPALVGVAKAP